jgi:hypothetical protein
VVNICKRYNWHGYLARKLSHTIRLRLDDRRSGFFKGEAFLYLFLFRPPLGFMQPYTHPGDNVDKR